ncbi:LYS-6.2 protein, partial [Aphelenchoides avenae]
MLLLWLMCTSLSGVLSKNDEMRPKHEGEFGVDIAYDPCSVECFRCLLRKKYTYFMAGVYHPQTYKPKRVNDVGFTNMLNAYVAGFTEVHAYYYPCTDKKYGCPNVTQQVNDVLDYMQSQPIFYLPTYWWIDIENATHWSTPFANWITIQQIFAAFYRRGHYNLGIYTNKHNWESIMGSLAAFYRYPLWWARYWATKDFSHFPAFGGWDRPYIHQYAGDVILQDCRIKVDLNWRP